MIATIRLYALGLVLAAGALLVALGVIAGQSSSAAFLLVAAVGCWISERERARRRAMR